MIDKTADEVCIAPSGTTGAFMVILAVLNIDAESSKKVSTSDNGRIS